MQQWGFTIRRARGITDTQPTNPRPCRDVCRNRRSPSACRKIPSRRYKIQEAVGSKMTTRIKTYSYCNDYHHIFVQQKKRPKKRLSSPNAFASCTRCVRGGHSLSSYFSTHYTQQCQVAFTDSDMVVALGGFCMIEWRRPEDRHRQAQHLYDSIFGKQHRKG